ncbi:MAG TPA: purine-nucleoside phosphorylase [Candidatus Limnocylindria bacterium]|nr:purine-nucleoside phosphorylase [Candidatus Limnocylindria bacterium]
MPAPTPHISARPGDFAPTVLMPGDPLRARFIAQNFLEGARLVNEVRGIHGYTGKYRGKPVSVMASGMGMPSIGIYSYELFNFYDVDSIIRVGSAGVISQKLRLRDVVAAVSCYTTSCYGAQFGFPGTLAPCADWGLLRAAEDAAHRMRVGMAFGPIYSSDVFYDETAAAGMLEKLGVLAVEMEAYALYLNAARAGKRALALLTVSDNPKTGEELSALERQESFTQMIEIALDIA